MHSDVYFLRLQAHDLCYVLYTCSYYDLMHGQESTVTGLLEQAYPFTPLVQNSKRFKIIYCKIIYCGAKKIDAKLNYS